MQKKLAKINIDFLTFLGSAVLAGAVAHFFFLKYSYRLFFFLHFLISKIRDFFDDLTKSTLLAGGISKS
jgi:phosphatidylglycerophosphate synthase